MPSRRAQPHSPSPGGFVSGLSPTQRLGAPAIMFMVVAAAAPLSVMAGTAPFALAVGGLAAPATFLIAGAVLAVFAFGFTRMTRVTRGSGAFYTYITLGLGRRCGAAAGVLAVVSYNAVQFGGYGLLGAQFSAACEAFTGARLPWWVFSLAAAAAVWLLGRRGIELSARILGFLLIVETVLLAALVVAVLGRGGHDGLGFTSFTPQAWHGAGTFAALGIAFMCFMGFESTALYRGEAVQPDRSIPRATYAALAFLAVFYALVLWTLVQAVGETKAVSVAGTDPTAMLTAVVDGYLGKWAVDVTHIFLVTSIFASQVAFHNAINRYTRSLASERLLPRALARTHPKFGSPSRAGAIQSALAVLVIAGFAIGRADPYLQMTIWVSTPGTVGILALQCLASAATIAFFWRRVRQPKTATVAAAATILLTVLLALVIDNIDLMTDAGTVTNAVLLVVPLAASSASPSPCF
ncbi:APC family permease [Microbispora sitophila]|uniref:APC family permease n=1 Tax=Microbispora sitophila TaxID=2771537 RepID=UPI001D009E2A|nr:APC family permease [Microbispora sitophila]